MAALSALISATNPATFLGSLSYRGWLGLGVCALLSYCNWISTARDARPARHTDSRFTSLPYKALSLTVPTILTF